MEISQFFFGHRYQIVLLIFLHYGESRSFSVCLFFIYFLTSNFIGILRKFSRLYKNKTVNSEIHKTTVIIYVCLNIITIEVPFNFVNNNYLQ